MKKLFLDTSVAKVAKVKITDSDETLIEVIKPTPLESIKIALDKTGLKLEEIDEFSANKGPGSYTGLRIGAAVINTLNWALGKKAKLIEPIYE